MKTLLITNRKGGVGKTTTTLNIAFNLAKRKKILIIDLDTQGHIQYGLGIRHNFELGIHKALIEDIDIKYLIQKTNYKNIYFIPANINFNSSLIQNTEKLKHILTKRDFDLCIIDTAPISDSMLEMAIIASDFIIVPMKTEYLGLVGTLQFIKIFYKTASQLNKDLKFLGVLPTLYNKSIKEHNEILKKLEEVVGKKRVLHPIRKDVKIANIFKFGIRKVSKEHSRAVKDYKKNAEYIEKIIFKS
jgi:chromosome partitioning protein